MGSTIITVLLSVVGFVFQYWLPHNAKEKAKEAELIGKWIARMDKAFLASPKISKSAKEIWKKFRETPWQETGVESEVKHPIQPAP